MSKIRNIKSLEKAVADTIKLVGIEKCVEAVKDLTEQNKSNSTIYKWSDPDTDQNIQHRYSIALDIACVKKGIKPPMLTIHQEILKSQNILLRNEKYDLISELLKVNSEIGDLNGSIESSTSTDSDEGKDLSSRELNDIKDVVSKIENQIKRLKMSLLQES